MHAMKDAKATVREGRQVTVPGARVQRDDGERRTLRTSAQLEKLLREMPTEWASQRKQFDEHLSWRAIKEARRSRYP